MFFYLEWINKRPDKILILNDKPNGLTFESNFKIKKKEYTICAKINPNFTKYSFPENPEYKKNQYLLSHLQKCIRRMDDVKSVKTAKHIINLDCNSFLRRLPIIMLEDVSIHCSFPVIIWLMIAYYKKFEMKNEIIKWLLGVVYCLSISKQKTYYEKLSEEVDIKEKQDDIFINTLRMRKAYGGMGGDMEMIEYYVMLIMGDKINIDNMKVPLVNLSIPSLLKNEWIYQANDFHCNRSIIKQVKNYFPNMNEEYIKTLIWNFSSSQNNRLTETIYDKNEYSDWLKIKKIVKKIQKSCIYY